MQKVFTTILITLCLTSYGQEGRWKPFKLIIIQPDTALIDKSLYNDRDSIVATQLNRYYNFIKQEEGILDCKGCDSSVKEKIKKELPSLKAYEVEVKKFKYFQTLSSYSTEVYNFYFNEYEPFSTIIELPNQNTDLISLNKTADTSKADYIVFFDNVHTIMQDGLPILKLTTSLYAKKENKIIFSKETEGDTNSRGDMWTCNMNVMLSCLLINGVRTSTDEVVDILRKRQIRK